MDVITKTSRLVSRLVAGAALVAFAGELLPRLVSDGVMSASTASVVLRQIPQLRDDLQRQIEAAEESLSGLQDRVEVLAQFLLLHRQALSADEADELERLLAAVRE